MQKKTNKWIPLVVVAGWPNRSTNIKEKHRKRERKNKQTKNQQQRENKGKLTIRRRREVDRSTKNTMKRSAKERHKTKQKTKAILATDHPLETGEAAHLSGGVDGRHAVAGAHLQRAAGLFDEVLEHVQVALLRRQVHRRHVVLHLQIGAVHTHTHTQTNQSSTPLVTSSTTQPYLRIGAVHTHTHKPTNHQPR